MSLNSRDVDVLVGMFPNLSLETIKKTLLKEKNDVSAATEVLMTLPDEKITPNQIRNMFPDLSQSVIHTVYQANNNNPEQTIDALLPITDPKEQLSSEERRLRELMEYREAFPTIKRDVENAKQHNIVEDEQARLLAFYKQTADEKALREKDEKLLREKEAKLRDAEMRAREDARAREEARIREEASARDEARARDAARAAVQRRMEEEAALERERSLEEMRRMEEEQRRFEKQIALEKTKEREKLMEERKKMEKARREAEEKLELEREQHRRELEALRRETELAAEQERREQKYLREQEERERALELERQSSRLSEEELRFKDEWKTKIENLNQHHKQQEERFEELERQMRDRILQIEEDRKAAAELLRAQEEIKAADLARQAEIEQAEAKRREEEERQRTFLADSAQTTSVVQKETEPSVTCTVNGSTISWEVQPVPAAPSTSWIGIYCHNQPDNKKHQTWFNVSQLQGKGTYEAKPGRYVARLFSDRASYEPIFCTPIITVGPEPTMCANVNVGLLNVVVTMHDLATKCAWVGVYPEGVRSNKDYTQYEKFADGSRDVTMKAPRVPGKYTARLFLAGSNNNDQARVEFVIENKDAINVEQSKVTLTTDVRATFTFFCGAEPSKYDWVGLYKADESNNKQYLFSVYTGGPKSHGTVTIPLKDIKGLAAGGVYDLRFFSGSDKYTTYTTTSFAIQEN